MAKQISLTLLQTILLELQKMKIRFQKSVLKKKLTIPNLPKPQYVVVHHGAGNWGFWQVNNHHKDKWGFKSSLGYYIGYHKWIAYDGALYVARRDNEEAAHTVEKGNPHWWNRNSVGICLQGNFEVEELTIYQLQTLKRELDKYDIPIKGHREIFATLCPGRNLWEWLIKYR